MVKNKHQKNNQKKKPEVKKRGNQTDVSGLRSQLDEMGLQIIEVTADGNCFFRALADQLEGNEEEHAKYRSMVVHYITSNREMFEPFVEDEVPFDEYCQSMEKDGTWAGNMELQAASLATRSNICIHRNMSPRWYIRNFDNQGAHMIHLSYHDNEHYNSVRSKEDPGSGPARPIFIKADANLTANSHKTKAASVQSEGKASKALVNTTSLKMVIAGSGCNDAQKVEQVLLQVHGDVDAAIEFLIADEAAEDAIVDNDEAPPNANTHGKDENPDSKQCKEEIGEANNKQVQPVKQTGLGDKSCKDEKKIPRNKVCPCGSKKKYKACCGAAARGTSYKLINEQMADSTKNKKGKKQGKKSEPAGVVTSYRSDEGLSDLGALCI